MLGRSHAILGIATTAVTLTAAGTHIFVNPPLFISALGIGTVAALLPDIDTADTYLRTSFRLGSRQTTRDLLRRSGRGPLGFLVAVLRWVIARLLDFIHVALPHRGPTHYGLTAVLLTLIVYGICRYFSWPWELWVAFGAGYFSHLLGDGVTKTGVRLYAPIYSRFVRFLPQPLCIVTGSWQEAFMLTVMIVLMVGGLFLIEVPL